ncbi:hypothetical protein NTG1052_350104 [Candidatus Nitrotoga sp. 1052]|nr:hypothetical protein NTG1052_350104 [Candidatus Nitrotoga sp. 1052]
MNMRFLISTLRKRIGVNSLLMLLIPPFILFLKLQEQTLWLTRSLSDFSCNSLIKLMRPLFNQINLYIKNNMLRCLKTRSPTVC